MSSCYAGGIRILAKREPGSAYQVNTTSYDDVKNVIDTVVKEFDGRLDIFVANSGAVWQQGPLLDGEPDHYKKVMSTNIDGSFYCGKALDCMKINNFVSLTVLL